MRRGLIPTPPYVAGFARRTPSLGQADMQHAVVTTFHGTAARTAMNN